MLSSVCSGFLCLGHFNKIIKMLSANWKTIIHLFKTFCVWAISTKLSKCALQTKKASSICSEFSTLGPSQQNRNAFIYFFIYCSQRWVFALLAAQSFKILRRTKRIFISKPERNYTETSVGCQWTQIHCCEHLYQAKLSFHL